MSSNYVELIWTYTFKTQKNNLLMARAKIKV